MWLVTTCIYFYWMTIIKKVLQMKPSFKNQKEIYKLMQPRVCHSWDSVHLTNIYINICMAAACLFTSIQSLWMLKCYKLNDLINIPFRKTPLIIINKCNNNNVMWSQKISYNVTLSFNTTFIQARKTQANSISLISFL